MNEDSNGPRFKAGDIVQEGGHGRGMVVADADKFKDRWWDNVPDAVVCEWVEDGQPRDLVYLARDLELVGSQRRRSDTELYEKMTAVALQSITDLAIEGNHQQALGAFKMWAALAGPLACDNDTLRLQQLVDRALS
jgi:hypothetical protein